MTYPQQPGYPPQGYPQQGYAPAPPQQYAPQAPAQQGYQAAQAAQQYVNQAQPPGWTGQAQQAPPAPSQELAFQDPSRGGGVTPSARHLEGRTVVIIPKRVDETTNYGGQARPTGYCDLYVIDGPSPMAFGDSEDNDPAKRRPPTHTIAIPAFFSDVMIGNTAIVGEIRAKLGPDGRPTGISVGIVQRGQKGNRPFMLTRCEKDLDGNDRPDGAQRKQYAQDLYFAHKSGQWTPPAAVPMANMAPPAGQNVVQYGPPPQQGYYGPTNTEAGYTQGAYAPQQAPPQQAYVPQGAYAQQAAPQSAPPAATPAPGGYPPPPNWTPEQWAAFPPDQQAQVWAQQAQQQAPQGGAPGGAQAPTGPQTGMPPAAPPAAGPVW